MRLILIYVLLIGLSSCSTGSQESNVVGKQTVELSETEMTTSEQKTDYRKLVLSENTLDTFSIPFPEKNMLSKLRNYYGLYKVRTMIGQQDGPDFTYIDISEEDNSPIAYLKFDPINKYKLDEIRIVSSNAIDQYGIQVGDSYQQLIQKRKDNFKTSTNYHQHTYLFAANSNILYELTGDFTMTEEMLGNIEEFELTEEQLQKCTVEFIIWRRSK